MSMPVQVTSVMCRAQSMCKGSYNGQDVKVTHLWREEDRQSDAPVASRGSGTSCIAIAKIPAAMGAATPALS